MVTIWAVFILSGGLTRTGIANILGRQLLKVAGGAESLLVVIIMVIAGGLFVLEALSVILQVLSYRIRSKRIFKMAPIHHHFEMLGWKESKVVVRFWIVGILLLLLGMSSIKLQ